MALDKRDSDHLFQELRQGTVPQRGLDEIAVGVERHRAEIARLLDMTKDGAGAFKFLRGGYGCGKTFMARLSVNDAQQRNFVTSFVVVSDNDLRFHHFNELYAKIVSELSTKTCPRGALGDILDRWIGSIEDSLLATEDEDAPGFDALVRKKLQTQLELVTGGKAPIDMVRVIEAIFDCKQQGDLATAGALISWLSGSSNVAASAKKRAAIKGDVGSADAMAYLRGILEIAKKAGYDGMLIVIDEAETILRMRRDVRGKSLNAIRQIVDAANELPGLMWMFTGTPEFFDNKRGVAGLEALHQRVEFKKHGESASLMQPQLRLTPFDAERLTNVALRLRGTYMAKHRERLRERVTDSFVTALVAKVTEGFAGDVGVVPRQFLREFVGVLDLVDQDDGFMPMDSYGFAPKELNEDEERRRSGRPPYDDEPDDDKGYELSF